MAKIKWEKSPFPGVRYYEHEARKHGIKKDRYYSGQYQVGGKRQAIGFGWASEGWTEKKVYAKLEEYRHNAKQGKNPTNLKEERQIEAEKRQKELEKKRKEQIKNITFSHFFNNTYLPQAKADKKPNSWDKEKSFFKNYIDPVIGDKPLRVIGPSDLEKIKEKMTKKDCAARTIQYCLATVRQVFNRAKALDLYAGDNPITKIKIPSPNNKRTRYLSWEEAEKLLNKLVEKSKELHDIALVSLHCGLRAGEIFKLKWLNLDFTQGIIHIRDAKANKDRYAFMTKTIKEILLERKEHINNDLVFPDRKGKERKLVSRVFSETVQELGLNKGKEDPRDFVCFHTLRHTFASWQIQSGMSLYELQKLLGHESYAMVQRYAHLAPENLKKATAIFDEKEKKVINFPS